MKKIYEFLLWNNCSNNCTFCHQRAHERRIDDKILTPQEQIESLKKCQEFLNSDQFEKGNHILLVGGEIFDVQNEDVKLALKKLFDQIWLMLDKQEIDLLYINTNLLYQDRSLLDYFLEWFNKNKKFDRLKFTTSYDMVGRFTSFDRERLFYWNLSYLTNTYEDIKIVVNTVLTKETCKRICEDNFGADGYREYMWHGISFNKSTIKNWIDYFKVDINVIPYIRLSYDKAPEMPSKKEVFNALLHINELIPGYLEQYADNIALKQEKLLFEYNKKSKQFIYCSSELGDCGHSVNFKLSFSDSDQCFPCEIKKLVDYKL